MYLRKLHYYIKENRTTSLTFPGKRYFPPRLHLHCVPSIEWKTYGRDRNTLVIDKEFRIVEDFNSSLRKAWDKVESRIPGNL